MACRLSLSQILQRLIPASYQGQPAGGVSSNYNYAYCLSDSVPLNKFWVVLYASVYTPGASAVMRAGLWTVLPGILPYDNSVVYSRNHQFFQGDIIATITNGPPVGYTSLRYDEFNDFSNTDAVAQGSEKVMLRDRKLLLASGSSLLAYGGSYGFGVGGGLGEQFGLQIAYAEFDNDETETVIAEVDF